MKLINAKKCPFCGSEPMTISTGNHFPEIYYRLICPKNCCMQSKLYDSVTKAITDWNARVADGETSDGYHTFNELYHHRAVLFSVIVAHHPELSWKSKRHHDGTMYDGMFIVGIETPEGQATYHYDIDPYWDMFDCKEMEQAPEWDGHTADEAIKRIGTLRPKRGRWMLSAHYEEVNYRWHVDAECSECCDERKEIWAGFFPGVPDFIAHDVAIQDAKQVELSAYCPNCGAMMLSDG